MGQPLGFTRPFSKRSWYSPLFRSLTESSNVSITSWGVSVGLNPSAGGGGVGLYTEERERVVVVGGGNGKREEKEKI